LRQNHLKLAEGSRNVLPRGHFAATEGLGDRLIGQFFDKSHMDGQPWFFGNRLMAVHKAAFLSSAAKGSGLSLGPAEIISPTASSASIFRSRAFRRRES
jgi:hypothetical protein